MCSGLKKIFQICEILILTPSSIITLACLNKIEYQIIKMICKKSDYVQVEHFWNSEGLVVDSSHVSLRVWAKNKWKLQKQKQMHIYAILFCFT